MSSLLYKQAVEQDMVAGILADVYQFSEDDLRRRRAESISNVKKTNGRISLDQRVRKAWEEGMSGRTDRQEFLLQVRRERHPQRLPALHRHAGTVENLPDNRPPESRNSSSQRWY